MINVNVSKNSGGSEFNTIMSSFHKDFVAQTDEMLSLMKKDHADRVDEKRKTKLRAVTSQSAGLTSTSQQMFTAQKGKITPSNSIMGEMVNYLKSIDKNVKYGNEREEKRDKTNFRSQALQARFLGNFIEKWTGIALKGPSEQERLLNAVQNVERAVRGEGSTELDERTGLVKILQSSFMKEHLPKMAQIGDFLEVFSVKKLGIDILNQNLGSLKNLGTSLAGTAKNIDVTKVADTMLAHLTSAMSSAKFEISPDVKENIRNVTGKVFGKVFDVVKNFRVEDAMVWFRRNLIRTMLSAYFFGPLNWLGTNIAFNLGRWYKGLKGTLKVGSFLATGIKKATGFLSENLIDPIRKKLGIEKKTLGKTRLGLNIASWIVGSTVDAIKTEGSRDFGKRIGTALGPLFGLIAVPLHALFLKERGSIGDTFTSFVKNMKEQNEKFKKFTKKGIKETWSGLTKGFQTMVKMFAKSAGLALANLPILIGVAIVAAIIGIGVLVYSYWDEIKEAFNEYIVQPIVSIFDGMVESIKGIFTGIGDAIETAVRSLPFGLGNKILGEGPSKIDEVNAGQSSKVTDGSPVLTANGKVDKAVLAKQMGVDMTGVAESMNGIKEALSKQQAIQMPATPPPAANIDDFSTYMATL